MRALCCFLFIAVILAVLRGLTCSKYWYAGMGVSTLAFACMVTGMGIQTDIIHEYDASKEHPFWMGWAAVATNLLLAIAQLVAGRRSAKDRYRY